MAAPAAQTLRPLKPHLSARSTAIRFAPVAIVYCLIAWVTRAEFLADTFWYVRDIMLFDRGSPSSSATFLWEFGHLLWRPFGWLLLRYFGGLTPYMRSGEANLACTALLVGFSLLCGLLICLIVQALAIRILHKMWAATLVSAAFICFYAFLNYIHSGTPYIPGLLFVFVAVWLTTRAIDCAKAGWWYGAVIASASAIATLFWFPYILSIPGVLAVAYFWDSRGTSQPASSGDRRLLMICIAGLAGVVIASVYCIAIFQLQIHSLAQLSAWVERSSHGWSQTKRLARMVSGLPRAFLRTGDDGIKLKQYLVRDPYARITMLSLIKAHIWKLWVFYSFAFSLFWILVRSARGRRVLIIFAAGSLPVLLFAAFVFESGSPERYFPLFPFLFLALAHALYCFPRPVLAQICTVGFLAVVIVMNTTQLSRIVVDAKVRRTADRVRSLEGKVNAAGMVALVTLGDDVYQFTLSFPFGPVNRRVALPVYDVIENGTVRVTTWKPEFARNALKSLQQGGNVWISKRLLAEQPDPAWKWTEGDDVRVSWKDLGPVFRRFQYAEDTGDRDGFVQLVNSRQNIALLETLNARD